ncbi:MAG: hypothetical protein IPL15_03680 [Comamonadaceae bacterium]|uniref:hypothetical protein n=1 Tax=Candidatus Skiveiella danica TaxID=3386177 RepID=UPI00390B5EE8|nr:hypothetical protein [Comamonadaceae bacterium]
MLLSGSLGALAQEAPAAEAKSLSSVTVREKAAPEEGRDSLRVTGDFNAHVGEADALRASAAAPTCSRPWPWAPMPC